MILDKKHAMQQKLFRQFAETEFTKELQDELDNTGEFNWEMHKKMSKYGFIAFIATSIISLSGSFVVSFWNHIPGTLITLTNLLSCLPASFIIS